MSDYLIKNPHGFPVGFTPITMIDEQHHDTGIAFGILKLTAETDYHHHSQNESAILLISGRCLIKIDMIEYQASRSSCFQDTPVSIHLPANIPCEIILETECEFAVMETPNDTHFTPMIYDQTNMLECEQRGKGVLSDTAHRIVRTIFDTRNSPHSKLVLGEVVNAPGRWSSYPPHHHPQPEIYHYRFSEPQGYGHAECGDHVFKVRHYDTYKILNEADHSQVAAPGYCMYYIWVIRHLNNQPYIDPVFNDAHQWTRFPEANDRVWNKGELP
jgi:5-dehydro-2-deoxygluconokinase